MAEETTKIYIQLRNAQGEAIFPRVDLKNVEDSGDFITTEKLQGSTYTKSEIDEQHKLFVCYDEITLDSNGNIQE